MAGEEIIFRNGAVFDGRLFLPEGTCVRVSGGTITAVGPAHEVAGPGGLARVNVVDLDGGTLLPGFTDAHVHPVYAGGQLRRCNLRQGRTAQSGGRLSWLPSPGHIRSQSSPSNGSIGVKGIRGLSRIVLQPA